MTGHRPVRDRPRPTAAGVLDEVDRLRDEADAVPVILTCGPSEQAVGAEREFRADIRVQRWQLDDRVDSDHVDELTAWFLARTGEPLDDFAQRFRRRVQSLDADRTLAPLLLGLLAVNRLYAGLPVNARVSWSPLSSWQR